VTPTPEPGSLGVCGLGLMAIVATWTLKKENTAEKPAITQGVPSQASQLVH
jgi:hypothetical protein